MNIDDLNELRQARESWEKICFEKELKTRGENKKDFTTASGIIVKRLYTPLDLIDTQWDYMEDSSFPGEYPFTRGISPLMYRSNIWVMMQLGGFGTAQETNKWFKYILEQGANMLVIAQDLPSQIGLDSDNPLSKGEVGKVGVAIDSLQDIETIFDGIPLEDIVVSTTSNATGPIFLALMLALADNRGLPLQKLKLSIQNDVLKEFICRGTYIFPPGPALKFSCDLAEYCAEHKLINVQYHINCGYHMREAGASAIQELAFMVTNSAAFVEELITRGIDLNESYRPVEFLVAGLDFFEEISKHRAYRRMFAKMMRERFKVTNPRAMSPIMYSSCQASSYTAQQPLNNIIRGTVTALVQALSGIQVMGIASFDEAYAIPSAEAVRLALRTQQIIAYETGVINTVDPLAGSYYVEALTDELEERATKIVDKVEALGGAVAAIEQGFQEREIAREAYIKLRQIKSGDKVVVGVNKFQVDERVNIKLMKVDPEVEERQIEKVKRLKKERDNKKVGVALNDLKVLVKEGQNLVPAILAAVKTYATIGEICDTLRDIYGEHKASTC